MYRKLSVMFWMALCLAACGDPLVSGDYRGKVLLRLSGPVDVPEGVGFLDLAMCEARVFECYADCETEECPACEADFDACAANPPPRQLAPFRLGIFWAQGTGAPVVQQFGLTVSDFPAQYAVTIYAPPPEGVLQPAEEGRFALGLLIVYLDQNGDGRFNQGSDPVVGGADGRAVVYTPDGLYDDRFGTLDAGYHRMSIVSVCTPAGGELVAQSDGAEMILTLSADPELQQRLLLDPDCDGAFDDFATCDPAVVERWCNQGKHLLCDLCVESLDEEEQGDPADPEEIPDDEL
jgi:hypothetical protein